MKKSVLSVVLGASLMVTSSAFALSAMTDSTMKAATGQAGVSIALDDITLYQSVGATIYTDTDGYLGTDADAAGVKITGVESLTTIRAIVDGGNRDGFLKNGYENIMNGTGTFTSADGYEINVEGTRTGTVVNSDVAIGAIKVAPLTIDVSAKVKALSYGMAFNHRNDAGAAFTGVTTMVPAMDFTGDAATNVGLIMAANPALSADQATEMYTAAAGVAYVMGQMGAAADLDVASFTVAKAGISVAGVVIGLPTIEIVKTGSVKSISMTGTTSANNDRDFIAIKTGDSSLAVLGGYIEICPH